MSSRGNDVKQETAAHESQRLSYTGILGFTLDPFNKIEVSSASSQRRRKKYRSWPLTGLKVLLFRPGSGRSHSVSITWLGSRFLSRRASARLFCLSPHCSALSFGCAWACRECFNLWLRVIPSAARNPSQRLIVELLSSRAARGICFCFCVCPTLRF